MDEKKSSTFEPNGYMDRLLELRDSDPARYRAMDPAVHKVLEEYEQEKKDADQNLRSQDQGG
jgi:hypothetical protein